MKEKIKEYFVLCNKGRWLKIIRREVNKSIKYQRKADIQKIMCNLLVERFNKLFNDDLPVPFKTK